MARKSFVEKERIAWSHSVGPIHGSKSVIAAAAVLAIDPAAVLGTVLGPANDVPTHWLIHLDGTADGETRVLTSDELVRIEE